MVREDPLCKEAINARAESVDIKNLPSMLTVTAKRADGLSAACGHQFDGIQPVMIFNLKGKRNIYVRLVKPSVSSLNSHDSFIIISDKDIIQWNGSKSSLIKKARATEIATVIIKSKQMRCAYGNLPNITQEDKEIDKIVFKMTKEEYKETFTPEDGDVPDSLFENVISDLTSIYEVNKSEAPNQITDDQLTKVKFAPSALPSFAEMSSQKCYIFDFLTEVYVWIGRMCTPEQKEAALAYGLHVYESPVNVANCDKSKFEDLGRKCVTFAFLRKTRGDQINRPVWSTFTRITERGEHEMFKAKFQKFPDFILEKSATAGGAKAQSAKPVAKSTTPKPAGPKLPEINIKALFDNETSSPFIIDNMVINRGTGGQDPESKFQFKVTTLGINVRVLRAEEFVEVSPELINFLHSSECYLIEWRFKYIKCGIKKLKSVFLGNQSKEKVEDVTDNVQSGRECSLCFYWQGRDCSTAKKGTSAYMTAASVGDEAHQILVEQGVEQPVFANIFYGSLIELNGSDKEYDWSVPHCFWIHGLDETETILYEVAIGEETLRTHAAYIVTDIRDGVMYAYLWMGSMHVNQMVAKTAFDTFHSRMKANWQTIVSCQQKDACLVPETLTLISSEISELDEPEHFRKIFAKKEPTELPAQPQSSSAKAKGALKRIRSRASIRRATDSPAERPLSSLKACVFNCETFPKVDGLLLNNTTGLHITCFDPEDKPQVNDFPLLQSHLYSLSQPALVFFEDSVSNCYLWHGWQLPEKQSVSDESAQVNLNKSPMQNQMFLHKLKVAEKSLKTYTEKSNRTLGDVISVFAGLEPPAFRQLFPYWEVNQTVKTIQEESGFNFSKITTFEDEIEHLFMGVFPLEVLQKRPLPENVDPTKIEMYLSDEEFMQVFEMSKEDFLCMSQWKRNEIRKQHNLF